MSIHNGDRSRFGRLRKQKLRKREETRLLRKKLLGEKSAAPAGTAAPAAAPSA